MEKSIMTQSNWEKRVNTLMIEQQKIDDEYQRKNMCNVDISAFFKTLSIYPCYSVGRNNIICDYKGKIQNHVNLDENTKKPITIDEELGIVFKKLNLDSTINPKTIMENCFRNGPNMMQSDTYYITDEYFINIKSDKGISEIKINKLSTTQANKN